jgi:hypothetical protein
MSSTTKTITTVTKTPVLTTSIASAAEIKDIVPVINAKIEKIGTFDGFQGEEMVAISLADISKAIIDHETTWDNLDDNGTLIPLVVPPNIIVDVYSLYINNLLNEYRFVINPRLNKYYSGEIKENPFPIIRYVYQGMVNAEPKLMVTDPLYYKNGTAMEYEVLKEAMDRNCAIFLDIEHKSTGQFVQIDVFAIYGDMERSVYPLEYRFVLDKNRMEFYKSKAITEERNIEIIEEEEEIYEKTLVVEDGVKIIPRV